MSPKDTTIPFFSGNGVLFVGFKKNQTVKAVIAFLQLLIPILTTDTGASAKLMLAVSNIISKNGTISVEAQIATGTANLNIAGQNFYFDLNSELPLAFNSAGLNDAILKGTISVLPSGVEYRFALVEGTADANAATDDFFAGDDGDNVGAGSGTAFKGFNPNKRIISILAMVAFLIANFTTAYFTPPGLVIDLIQAIRKGGILSVKASAKTGKLDVTVGGNTLGLTLTPDFSAALNAGGLSNWRLTGNVDFPYQGTDPLNYGFIIVRG